LPSEKTIELKKEYVASLADVLKNSCAGVLVEYKGVSVEKDTKLRSDLREAGVKYSVVKNTMLKRAADSIGLEGLDDVLKGTTALATSADDYVAAARILCKFAETNKGFSVKAGFMDGKVIQSTEVEGISKLPSREILIATVLGGLNAPIAALARAVQAIADQKSEEQPA
jgi:large subunit ribosomal protein L10